jgi:hypothetical protein
MTPYYTDPSEEVFLEPCYACAVGWAHGLTDCLEQCLYDRTPDRVAELSDLEDLSDYADTFLSLE